MARAAARTRRASIASDLHLDEAHAGLRPRAELIAELVVAVAREAAAAIRGDALPRAAEEDGERDAEELGLRVPKRGIDRGYRHGAETGYADVSQLARHVAVSGGDVEHVLSLQEWRKLSCNQHRRRAIGICV